MADGDESPDRDGREGELDGGGDQRDPARRIWPPLAEERDQPDRDEREDDERGKYHRTAPPIHAAMAIMITNAAPTSIA